MAKYLNQAQPLRQRASELSKRIDTIAKQSGSSEWPYSSLNKSVRLYAAKMAETARVHLHVVADELQIAFQFVDKPLSEINDQRLQRHFREVVQSLDKHTEQEIAEATFAACETHLKVTANLVAHLEALIEGDQDMHGRLISRGGLWRK